MAPSRAQDQPRPRPFAEATSTRRTARRLLDDRLPGRETADGHGVRLTLVLAVVILLTAAVSTYALGTGLYSILVLLSVDSLWADLAAYALMGFLGIFVLLPLAAGTYRLACLAAWPAARPDASQQSGPSLPSVEESPELYGIFHPFTSLRAYGRSLCVGLEWLLWGVLIVGVPAIGYRLPALLSVYLPEWGLSPVAIGWLTTLAPIACTVFGIAMLVLSGLRAGYAYFVFIHAPLTLGEINRYFRGFRRSLLRPLALRVSLLGWVAVSILAILVPFVLHTVPYALCCSTAYAAALKRNTH